EAEDVREEKPRRRDERTEVEIGDDDEGCRGGGGERVFEEGVFNCVARGYRVTGPRGRCLVVGYRLSVVGVRFPGAGCRRLVPGTWSPVPGTRSPVLRDCEKRNEHRNRDGHEEHQPAEDQRLRREDVLADLSEVTGEYA